MDHAVTAILGDDVFKSLQIAARQRGVTVEEYLSLLAAQDARWSGGAPR